MSKIKIPKPVIGYGYSGAWCDPENTIGWNTTPFIAGKTDRKYPSDIHSREIINKKTRFFLCKITIEPLLDKLGRPITKIIKPPKD
jgi:hypothetical protein